MKKLRVIVILLIIILGIISLANVNVVFGRTLDVRGTRPYGTPGNSGGDTREYILRAQPPRYHIIKIFDVREST
ncbi:MAG: hypothetical protein FWC79_03205 [Oscillospiraceae bacterium]|nr:hypothetical protein [Oscillospiraceae bacterium]